MAYTKDDFDINYWRYFLSLEEEFINIETVIPIDDINNKTFSVNYMKIYFSICSEIDVLLKSFIEYNNWYKFTQKNGDFGKYKNIINQNIPTFSNEIIVFSEKKEIKPFDNWKLNKKPIWWESYNDIKHNRTLMKNGLENYKMANQENILNAFCALYQIEMYFYRSIIDKNNFKGKLRMPVPQSRKLRIKNWPDNSELIDNRYILYIDDNGNLFLEGVLN